MLVIKIKTKQFKLSKVNFFTFLSYKNIIAFSPPCVQTISYLQNSASLYHADKRLTIN